MLVVGSRCGGGVAWKALNRFLLIGACVVGSAMRGPAQDTPCGPDGLKGPLRKLVPQQSFGADFRPACRAHDACYDTPGTCRDDCDKQLRENMLSACQCSSRPVLCRMTARNMSRLTRLSGKKAFDKAQTVARATETGCDCR